MLKPIIGAESFFFTFMISIILILYAVVFYPIVEKSFKVKSNNRWNSLMVIIFLVILALLISLPFSYTFFYLFMPLNCYLVVTIGMLALLFFLYAKFHKDEEQDSIVTKKITFTEIHSDFSPKQEIKRKLVHLFAIFYIATWIVEPMIFFGVKQIYETLGAFTTSYEDFHNALYLFEDTNIELILSNGLVIQFFVIFGTLFINLNMEIIRLRFPEYNFPFKHTLKLTRRLSEENDITHSILLLLGLLISSLILTYGPNNRIQGTYAQMAVISITVLSDMAAAIIGKRYGTHKWAFNNTKSLEGSLAGVSIGFLTATVFVGPILAFIGCLIFIFTDVILSKYHISDNISNPILMALIYKLLIFLVIPLIYPIPFIRFW